MGLRIIGLLHRMAFIASRGSRRPSLLVSLFPSLSPPPLSLLPNDSGLSFRDSGLSVNPDFIIYKVCAHPLPQACLAAGGRTSINSCCFVPQVPAEGPQKLPSPTVT